MSFVAGVVPEPPGQVAQEGEGWRWEPPLQPVRLHPQPGHPGWPGGPAAHRHLGGGGLPSGASLHLLRPAAQDLREHTDGAIRPDVTADLTAPGRPLLAAGGAGDGWGGAHGGAGARAGVGGGASRGADPFVHPRPSPRVLPTPAGQHDVISGESARDVRGPSVTAPSRPASAPASPSTASARRHDVTALVRDVSVAARGPTQLQYCVTEAEGSRARNENGGQQRRVRQHCVLRQ